VHALVARICEAVDTIVHSQLQIANWPQFITGFKGVSFPNSAGTNYRHSVARRRIEIYQQQAVLFGFYVNLGHFERQAPEQEFLVT